MEYDNFRFVIFLETFFIEIFFSMKFLSMKWNTLSATLAYPTSIIIFFRVEKCFHCELELFIFLELFVRKVGKNFFFIDNLPIGRNLYNLVTRISLNKFPFFYYGFKKDFFLFWLAIFFTNLATFSWPKQDLFLH